MKKMELQMQPRAGQCNSPEYTTAPISNIRAAAQPEKQAVPNGETFRNRFDSSFHLHQWRVQSGNGSPTLKPGFLMIDQVKPTFLEGTAVRFDLSKGKGIK